MTDKRQEVLNICAKLMENDLIKDIGEKNGSIQMLVNINTIYSDEEEYVIRDKIKQNFDKLGYRTNILGTFWIDVTVVDVDKKVDACFGFGEGE
jgi:hypothetical protein